MAWSPAEVTELVKAVFFGVATLCIPLGTVYVMIGAARAKRAEAASIANGASIRTLEKNTNSISERNEAIAKKLGITEGVAQERASVLAHSVSAPQVVMQPHQPVASAPPAAGRPLPVADERTAVAAERTATATEDSAKAAERVADVAEEAAKKT